jgi:anion-transporting  ArsA/GET3 family ATPase
MPRRDGGLVTDILVCCGVGGTGKTTISASIALSLALAGRRTVVLTIDPAKRLADALGLSHLDNEPRAVPLPSADGSLHALMLDRKATFDGLVRRLSPDAETAARLLENPYYQAVSTRLTGSHEYMANEKLLELVESGQWDAIVLDTPPSQHAVDFFRAPERLGRLFENGVLSVLTASGGGLLGAATRQAMKVVERIGGGGVLQDIRDFFRLISGLSGAISARNKTVHALLRSPRARFYLVSRPSPEARDEVADFTQVLREEGLALAGLIVNRVTLAPLFAAPLDASRLPSAPTGVEPTEWGAAMDALLLIPSEVSAEARRHAELCASLARLAGSPTLYRVPDVSGGARTLDALRALHPSLPPA